MKTLKLLKSVTILHEHEIERKELGTYALNDTGTILINRFNLRGLLIN